MIWKSLSPHSATKAGAVSAVEGIVTRTGSSVGFRLRVYGRTDGVELAELLHPSDRRRVDELWRSTCLELFVRVGDRPSYYEFNLGPQGNWAAYAFESYRTGMRDLETTYRLSQAYRDNEVFDMSAAFHVDELPEDTLWRASLAAVIEETDGTKSYWALAHPDGPPDFHDPACFVLELPAAG